MNPSTYVQTAMKFNYSRLLAWWLVTDEPRIIKGSTDDYANKYIEPGSVGYGFSLHTFFPPAEADIEQQRPDAVADPMIRSKGIIRNAGGWRHICNSDYTLRRDNVCTGHMEEILDRFPEAYRGAVWAMKPGFKFVSHIDFPNNETYRMHIVLQTNPKAFFQIGEETFHMPTSNRIWMINTGDHIHTAWNGGGIDRIHIHWQMPIDTWDKYVDQDILI
jgi:hypothetical protein